MESTNTNINYFSSTVAFFFSSFLSGQSVYPLTGPKYIRIYPTTAENLTLLYEDKNQDLDRVAINSLASSRVRISDEVRTSSEDMHAAAFIATFNGLSSSLKADNKSNSCFALVHESNLLVATDMDPDIYEQLMDGLRVDLEWKISLTNSQDLKG